MDNFKNTPSSNEEHSVFTMNLQLFGGVFDDQSTGDVDMPPTFDEGNTGDDDITGDNPAPSNEVDTDESIDNDNKLYAGRYKSVEELENAYKNLQSFSTKVAQELANYKKQQSQQNEQLPQQSQQFQQNQQVQTQFDEINRAFIMSFQQNPVGTIQQLIQHATQQVVQPLAKEMEIKTGIAELSTKYPDFPKLAPKTIEVLRNMPDLWNIPNTLEVAYKLAKADYTEQAITQARNSSQQQAITTTQQKQSLFNEAQSPRQTTGQTKTPEQMIKESILNAGGGGLFT